MFALLFLCAVLLSGCTRSSSAEPGAVTVALDQNPDSLDPRIGQNAASQHLAALIFSSSLVRKNEKYQIVPDLASEWEMPDPRTYVFYLRHDVRFHDGTQLTSRDVQYTFRSLLDGTVSTIKAGHPYNLIDSVEAPDPYTVVFKLKDVYAPFLWNVAVGVIGVIPEGSGKDFSRHLIGSGPFKLVRYIQDQEIVLERNDSYFGKRAEVPILRFRIIPEEVVVALELRKGALDIALQVLAPDMVEVLKHDPNLKVVEAPGTNYQYMAFNLNDPIFRDLRVRQAFAYGIDREQIIKYLWRGLARPAVGLLPPNNWAYNRDVRTYSYDPQRARSLLREAGYEHLTFTYRLNNDNDTARQMASIFQQQLREIGVTMLIQGNEFATFFADVMKGNFQVYSLRWLGANNDPDVFNYVFHSKSTPPNGANRGHYSNPKVDQLIELARRDLDLEKRQAAYHEIQHIVAEDLPYVSLFYMDNVCVYNKRIEGIRLYPAADLDFLKDIRIASSN